VKAAPIVNTAAHRLTENIRAPSRQRPQDTVNSRLWVLFDISANPTWEDPPNAHLIYLRRRENSSSADAQARESARWL
jgi:hypothetical protein